MRCSCPVIVPPLPTNTLAPVSSVTSGRSSTLPAPSARSDSAPLPATLSVNAARAVRSTRPPPVAWMLSVFAPPLLRTSVASDDRSSTLDAPSASSVRLRAKPTAP